MSAAAIARDLTGRRLSDGSFIVRCPVADHGKGQGDRRPSLSIRDGVAKLVVHCHGGCDPLAVLDELRKRGLLDNGSRMAGAASPITMLRDQYAGVTNREKARFLWRQRQSISGTPAEYYLRHRGFRGEIPTTLAFLPARSKYPCAMIGAFTMPSEPAPGVLVVEDTAVIGAHFTRLTADGQKADVVPAKVMLGRSIGTPIVLSPLNEALGLVIAEGIESGLSLLEATGCGVWAAGSANRMPALADAVPSFVDCVSVAGEPDGGALFAARLVDQLRARGIRADLRILGQMR